MRLCECILPCHPGHPELPLQKASPLTESTFQARQPLLSPTMRKVDVSLLHFYQSIILGVAFGSNQYEFFSREMLRSTQWIHSRAVVFSIWTDQVQECFRVFLPWSVPTFFPQSSFTLGNRHQKLPFWAVCITRLKSFVPLLYLV